MKVLITGAGGLLGKSLAEFLTGSGHTVVSLRRAGISAAPGEPAWNAATGEIDSRALEGADAVVHLAGENIGAKRWSPAQKARIVESRVGTTRRLCEHLAASSHRPRVFLGGSAMGFYGDQGEAWLDESSPRGQGFLAELCQAWEDSTRSLVAAGVRVVSLRTAVVLTPKGAPLSRMLIPFRLGLGGPIGDGTQYMSWIDLEDHIRAMHFLLEDERARGPVNLAAPAPVTNAEFTRILARVLSRPAFARVPAFAIRAALGELADELLLASTRLRPSRLREWGFEFQYPDLESSLRHSLGRI
jgi:uncharacterized protein (TIGR01777 family)